MYISLVLLGCALWAAWVTIWLRTRRARRLLAGLPCYPELPFFGSVHKFFGGGERILRTLTELSAISDEKSLPFLLWIGPVPALMFTGGEDIKTVTNAFIEKPYYYSFARPWLGNGLVTGPGSIWKHNIRNLAGTFNTTVVDGYQNVFNAQAQNLVRNLKKEVGAEPFDAMHKYLAYTTLETVCQTALGVPDITDSIVTAEYYASFNMAVKLLIRRGLNLFQHWGPLYRLSSSHKQFMKCIDVIHNVSDTVINRRKLEWEEKKKSGVIEKEADPSEMRFKSFLDILLEISERDENMTLEQLKAEVDTIIVGGQETVATTLFYCLLMIGCNDDVQNKLYEELKEIFGDSKRAVQKQDLAQMKYCEAVIYETLRLYPPAPVVMRYADKDLKLATFTIPKDTACGINAWGAGRSRRLWGADVLSYRPERWLEADLACTHATGLLAFSYGRRSCIGKKYAMAFLKTALAYCVRELRIISDAENLRLRVDLALRPVSGHLLKVQLR
uniref:Cytochrome P450 monooxygenase CYP366A1 n=1 Tax=Ostrinia furnacalis TaxID=93504 RepID=A0A7S9CEF5_OSTFU|nr:cytochrome P450 monooxygenase CYP366A1 [Ostrinia furnacalis]